LPLHAKQSPALHCARARVPKYKHKIISSQKCLGIARKMQYLVTRARNSITIARMIASSHNFDTRLKQLPTPNGNSRPKIARRSCKIKHQIAAVFAADMKRNSRLFFEHDATPLASKLCSSAASAFFHHRSNVLRWFEQQRAAARTQRP